MKRSFVKNDGSKEAVTIPIGNCRFYRGVISWDNNTTAKERFRYLLLYLESKRILTNPFYADQGRMHCFCS